jgi:hypothetical protein
MRRTRAHALEVFREPVSGSEPTGGTMTISHSANSPAPDRRLEKAARVADCRRMRADTQRTSSSAGSTESRALAGRGLPRTVLNWFAQVLTGRATRHRPDDPRTVSTAFEDPASTRLGQFFGTAADEHPGLSGFSLLSHGREAFIVRLALADLAERSLDMQYYSWDGDTTGRIIVDHVMKAADRGVRVRLLVDDPFYKSSDSVNAGRRLELDDTSTRRRQPPTRATPVSRTCCTVTAASTATPTRPSTSTPGSARCSSTHATWRRWARRLPPAASTRPPASAWSRPVPAGVCSP